MAVEEFSSRSGDCRRKAVPYTRSAALHFKSLFTAAQQHKRKVLDPTVGIGLGTQRPFEMAVKPFH